MVCFRLMTLCESSDIVPVAEGVPNVCVCVCVSVCLTMLAVGETDE